MAKSYFFSIKYTQKGSHSKEQEFFYILICIFVHMIINCDEKN
jgi:hypothetical protein